MCDEMLAGLNRWLRAAGYDSLLVNAGADDATVLATACEDERRLLTRDTRLAHAAGADVAMLLKGQSLDEQALEVAPQLDVDWTAAPFTRCLVANHLLRAATEDQRLGVPDLARHLPGPFLACPACNRIYWPGSHVRRMMTRLRRWRAEAAVGPCVERPAV